MLSHPQSVLQEWLASCILSLSMTLFLGPDHWRPHSEAVAFVALKGGLQEQIKFPLLNSENSSLICTSIYMYLGSSLHRILDLLTNKIRKEGHLGLN